MVVVSISTAVGDSDADILVVPGSVHCVRDGEDDLLISVVADSVTVVNIDFVDITSE